MKTLLFDCFSGISGDMTVAALLDAGLPSDFLQSQLSRLNLDGYEIKIKKVVKHGITATKFDVIETESQNIHRHLSDITIIIKTAKFDKVVEDDIIEMFTILAKAESEVHGTSIDEVHFHEVGAIDSIIDICSVAIGMNYFGFDRIVSTDINVGSGQIESSHGILPVPTPATEKLLRGIPVYSNEIKGELVTPTGATILRKYVSEFVCRWKGKLIRSGYGSGTKDLDGIANVLRLSIIEEEKKSKNTDSVIELQFQVDDMTGEEIGYFVSLMEKSTALDFIYYPVSMKKSRIGTKFEIFIKENDVDLFEKLIFTHSTTLGIRVDKVQRRILQRKTFSRKINSDKIEYKNAYFKDEIVNSKPEFDDIISKAEKDEISWKKAKAKLSKELFDD